MQLDKDTGAKSRHKNTRPAHDLSAYAGDYQHLTYGTMSITDERSPALVLARPARDHGASSSRTGTFLAQRLAAQGDAPRRRRLHVARHAAGSNREPWLAELTARATLEVAAPDAASRAGTGKNLALARCARQRPRRPQNQKKSDIPRGNGTGVSFIGPRRA